MVEAAARSGRAQHCGWASELGREVRRCPDRCIRHVGRLSPAHPYGQATLVSDVDDVRALTRSGGTRSGVSDRGPDGCWIRLIPSCWPYGSRCGQVGDQRPELAVKCGQFGARIVGALVELEVLGLVAQDQTGAWPAVKRSVPTS